MPTVEVVRLRGIAETVRLLPHFYRASTIAGHYFCVAREGAGFIREAETLGAFHGDSVYGRIGKKLNHPRCLRLDRQFPKGGCETLSPSKGY
jgi:hypothetical protein